MCILRIRYTKERHEMKITITKGKGTGTTLLASFDKALQNCGVANYNLIPLSSVIPPATEIVRARYQTPESEWGHKLYVVKAEMRSDIPGKFVGAAIGWHQVEGKKGLFVEHEAIGDSESDVRQKLTKDVTNSLTGLCNNRNMPPKDSYDMEVIVDEVKDEPTCALVLAIYQAEGWR